MTIKIETTEPKHAPELLTAVESTLRAHNLRLKPGVGLEDVIEGMAANQVTLAETHGYLTATMKQVGGTDAPVHVAQTIEAYAAKQPERFFPRETSGITSRDQMDNAAKMKMLSEPGGLARFEKLPATAPTVTTVVLDKSRLTRAQYLSLDRATRATLSGQWGADIIAKVMNRK